MTAPNDVAALVERLRARTFSRWESDLGAVMDYEDELCTEAAEALATQAATIAALQAENFALAAQICHDPIAGEYGDMVCRKVAALQAEVERAKREAAEDERDRLYAVMCEIWSTQTARAVLRQEGAMRPGARSALRKENTP